MAVNNIQLQTVSGFVDKSQHTAMTDQDSGYMEPSPGQTDPNRNSRSSGLSENTNNNTNPKARMNPSQSVPLALRQNGGNFRPESSIDGRGHEYEELPGYKFQPPVPEDPYSEVDQHSAPTLPIKSRSGSLENLCDNNTSRSTKSQRYPNTYRKRLNPLYDATEHDEKLKPTKSKSSWCGRPTIWLVIVGLLAILACLLSAYSILQLNSLKQDVISDSPQKAYLIGSSNDSQLQQAMKRISELEDQYNQLLQKHENLSLEYQYVMADNGPIQLQFENQAEMVDSLLNQTLNNDLKINDLYRKVMIVENGTGSINQSQHLLHEELQNEIIILQAHHMHYNKSLKSFSESFETLNQQFLASNATITSHGETITSNQDEIESTKRELSAQISAVKEEMENISKAEGPMGPQGPPGAGDLSRCEMKYVTSGAHAATNNHSTYWWPKDSENNIAEDWIVTGVDCAVENGALAALETQDNSLVPGTRRYRCTCTSNGATSGSRRCIMRAWLCPKTS